MFCGGPSHVLKTAAYDPVTHKGLPRPTAPNEASNVFLRLPGDYGDTKETEKAVDFHNEHCGESCHKDCKLDQAFREGEENLKKWSFQDAHAACNGESDDHADILLESLSHDTGENISTTNKSKLLIPFAQDPRGREIKEHECIICGENIGEDEPSVRWKTQRQFPLKIIDRENGVVPQLKGPLEKLKDYDKWQKRYENYLDGAQSKWKTTPATEFNEISTGHLPEGQRDSNAVARRSTFDDGFEPMHAKPCFKMFTSPYGCPAARNRDPEDFEHGTGGKGHFKPSTNKISHWKQRYAIAQYNYQFSPELDGKTYENMKSKTKKFYDDGGSVDIHHFDLSKGKFPKDKAKADHFLQQSIRLQNIAKTTTDPVKFRGIQETSHYAENISRFYRTGRYPMSYTRNARQNNMSTVFAFSRDSDGNITAAASGQVHPGDENRVRSYVVNGTASSVPGHATVVQHALLHHVVGEHTPVFSQVFNPTVNYEDANMKLKPWDSEDQKQQDNAIKYHKGLGRRLEHEPSGNITSTWLGNDVTRLIRNTRTKTNVKHIWN